MCGICGIVNFDGRPVDRERVADMSRALLHRGPDDQGLYFSADHQPGARAQAGFGFRRLSIIDIEGGHQPMRYKNLTIVFNGEIYNYRELRESAEKSGEKFSSHSDTEVILHLYDRYGPDALAKLNGMFAFAIWDSEKQELFLARDRLGIKPLYYAQNGGRFVFSSEMASLVRSNEVSVEFDPSGIMDFFGYRFVPAPHTVLQKVRKVRPGHFVRVKNGQANENSYWTLNGKSEHKSPAEWEEQLSHLLDESVRMQMISDVPVGAFLSGGVDSSLVSALMTRQTPNRIKTFSIGFEKGTGVDESRYARAVAKHLGTDHYEFILREKDMAYSDRIFSRMNEPVGDPTVLPTAILSSFARRKVKVVLTGEGGDELFAGYNRYKSIVYSSWIKKFPAFMRPAAGMILRRSGRGDTFKSIPDLDIRNWFLLNRDFAPETLAPLFQMSGSSKGRSHLLAKKFESSAALADPLNQILDIERQTALVDRLLMKVDMSSMSVSLEARPPFLDHRIVELALQMPADLKIRHFKGKYLLRKIAARYLPRRIAWRRKHGFIVPITQWVGGQSRDHLESILDRASLKSLNLFDVDAVIRLKDRAFSGKDSGAMALLWPVLVLTSWSKSLKIPQRS